MVSALLFWPFGTLDFGGIVRVISATGKHCGQGRAPHDQPQKALFPGPFQQTMDLMSTAQLQRTRPPVHELRNCTTQHCPTPDPATL